MNEILYDGKGNFLGFAVEEVQPEEYIRKSDVVNALGEIINRSTDKIVEIIDETLEELPTYKVNSWTKCEDRTPDDSRLVLCRGTRGGVYIGKFSDGYYWCRPNVRGGDCEPIEWMDIPEFIEKEKPKIKTKEIKYFDEDEKVLDSWKSISGRGITMMGGIIFSNRKIYETPKGKIVFEHDDSGVGVISLECMDMIMNGMNKWTACEEKLPEKVGDYLVTVTSKFPGSVDYVNISGFAYGKFFLDDVVAWMPLPKPWEVNKK